MDRNRTEIERFAEKTLRDHGLLSIPVDPVLLANRLGISVNHASFSEDNISGLIAKRDDNTMVLVNSNDSPYRKRFTIAHEIGHYLLHLYDKDGELVDHDLNLFRTNDETSPEDKSLEVEANQFAAAILMPDIKVREAWKLENSVEKLAMIFNVSEEAMGYRITTLRLV